MTDANPIYSPFFGVMGAASAIIFSGKRKSQHDIFFVAYVICFRRKHGSLDTSVKSLCVMKFRGNIWSWAENWMGKNWPRTGVVCVV